MAGNAPLFLRTQCTFIFVVLSYVHLVIRILHYDQLILRKLQRETGWASLVRLIHKSDLTDCAIYHMLSQIGNLSGFYIV